jgi:recombinational DNA repair protein RecT
MMLRAKERLECCLPGSKSARQDILGVGSERAEVHAYVLCFRLEMSMFRVGYRGVIGLGLLLARM